MSTINHGAEAIIKLFVENRTLDKTERTAQIAFDDAFDYVNDDADVRVVIAYLEMGLARNAMEYWNEKREAYEDRISEQQERLEESMYWDQKIDEGKM